MLWYNAARYYILKVVMVANTNRIEVNGGNMSELSAQLDGVSDYFVCKSNQLQKPITNKKIQKLAYYAQAWCLVFNDGKNLFDDPIEAWMHGPAIRSLWHKYKKYGYNPITKTPQTPNLDADTTSLLEEIWRVYGKYDAEYLESLTHSEDPWRKAREGLEVDESSSIVIKNSDMKQYYAQLNA